MKKLMLLSVALLCSVVVNAQTTSEEEITAAKLSEGTSFEEEFSVLDMKIFHDRQIMKEIVQNLYNIEQNPPTITEENIKNGLLAGSDVEAVNANLKKSVNYGLTKKPLEELLQKVDEDPFEAFKEMVMNTPIPKLSSEETKGIKKIDPENLTKTMRLMTASGPAIGAKRVPLTYNEAQK